MPPVEVEGCTTNSAETADPETILISIDRADPNGSHDTAVAMSVYVIVSALLKYSPEKTALPVVRSTSIKPVPCRSVRSPAGDRLEIFSNLILPVAAAASTMFALSAAFLKLPLAIETIFPPLSFTTTVGCVEKGVPPAQVPSTVGHDGDNSNSKKEQSPIETVKAADKTANPDDWACAKKLKRCFSIIPIYMYGEG
jgi:hypothetical protein